MRTTLDIEDDLLAATREISRRERISAGQAVSRLLRVALAGQAALVAPPKGRALPGGFRPFAARGTPVTNDLIDRLRDSEGV